MSKRTLILVLTFPFTLIQIINGAICSAIIWLVDKTFWNNYVIEEKMRQEWYPYYNWILSEADEKTRRWLNQKEDEWRNRSSTPTVRKNE